MYVHQWLIIMTSLLLHMLPHDVDKCRLKIKIVAREKKFFSKLESSAVHWWLFDRVTVRGLLLCSWWLAGLVRLTSTTGSGTHDWNIAQRRRTSCGGSGRQLTSMTRSAERDCYSLSLVAPGCLCKASNHCKVTSCHVAVWEITSSNGQKVRTVCTARKI